MAWAGRGRIFVGTAVLVGTALLVIGRTPRALGVARVARVTTRITGITMIIRIARVACITRVTNVARVCAIGRHALLWPSVVGTGMRAWRRRRTATRIGAARVGAFSPLTLAHVHLACLALALLPFAFPLAFAFSLGKVWQLVLWWRVLLRVLVFVLVHAAALIRAVLRLGRPWIVTTAVGVGVRWRRTRVLLLLV